MSFVLLSRCTLLAIGCLASIAGCTGSVESKSSGSGAAQLKQSGGEELDVPEQVRRWPDVPYHEVRGYSFNFAGSPTARILDAAGKLDPSVREPAGVALKLEQVERLLKVVRHPEKVNWATGCVFTPRHAFVFFDDSQKPVAQLEICFECYQVSARPAINSIGTTVDYGAFDALFQELGIPGKLQRDEYGAIAARERPAVVKP